MAQTVTPSQAGANGAPAPQCVVSREDCRSKFDSTSSWDGWAQSSRAAFRTNRAAEASGSSAFALGARPLNVSSTESTCSRLSPHSRRPTFCSAFSVYPASALRLAKPRGRFRAPCFSPGIGAAKRLLSFLRFGDCVHLILKGDRDRGRLALRERTPPDDTCGLHLRCVDSRKVGRDTSSQVLSGFGLSPRLGRNRRAGERVSGVKRGPSAPHMPRHLQRPGRAPRSFYPSLQLAGTSRWPASQTSMAHLPSRLPMVSQNSSPISASAWARAAPSLDSSNRTLSRTRCSPDGVVNSCYKKLLPGGSSARLHTVCKAPIGGPASSS